MTYELIAFDMDGTLLDSSSACCRRPSERSQMPRTLARRSRSPRAEAR